MTDDVSTQTDVNTDTSSPASTEPASSAPVTGETTQEAAPKEVPFHEHPRFQELVKQKNEYQAQLEQMRQAQQQYEQRFQQLQSQLNPQKQFDPNKFLERAKQIDPEFAQTLEWQREQQQQLQQRIESMNAERLRETAYSKLNSLFDQNKVAKEYRPVYEAAIKAAAYENPRFGVQDLDSLFSKTHETYSKLFDDMKRAERASYVEQKKKDATPATQTGGNPATPGTAKKPMTHDELVQMAAQELRRAKQKIYGLLARSKSCRQLV